VKRRYIRSSRANWWRGRPDDRLGEEFILQGDDPDIEFVVTFHNFSSLIQSEQRLAARVCIFDESWQAYVVWRDLFEALGEMARLNGAYAGSTFRVSPDEFEAILCRLGIPEDMSYIESDFKMPPLVVRRAAFADQREEW
jgi:hypothetical protein